MKRIFINYSWKHHQQVAKELYDFLKNHPELDIWMDKEDLDAGMKWKPAIRKAIRESDYFISILSKESIVGRGVRNKEIYEALEVLKEFPPGEIFLIPTLSNECDPPFEEMHDLNWVKLFPDKVAGYKSILKVVANVVSVESENTEKLKHIETEILKQLNGTIAPTKTDFNNIAPDLQFKLDRLLSSYDRFKEIEGIKSSLEQDLETTFNDLPPVLTTQQENIDLSSIIPDISNMKYHYRVGLVNIDLASIKFDEIAKQLNKIQAYFHFTLPVLPKLKRVHETFEGTKNLAVYKVPDSYFINHPNYSVDLIACITKYPLAFYEGEQVLYNYYAGESSQDERFMFISTDQLVDFCKSAGCKLEEGIVSIMVGQLIAYFTKIDYHNETRGCALDFCENRADIVESLKIRKLCPQCARRIKNGPFKRAINELLKWQLKIE